jgi:magnesium transporter
MLYASRGGGERFTIESDRHVEKDLAVRDLAGVAWFDLFDATDAERALVERVTGLVVPAMADLAEIESSSRLNHKGGVLTLSTPMSYLDSNGLSHTKPLGFVLSERYLITVRFCHAPVFEQFGSQLAQHADPLCAAALFVRLLEAIVDRLADVLESIRGDLDQLSHRVFHPDKAERVASKIDLQLRATLRSVGRAGDRLSNLRDSLLGIQRIVLYSTQHASGFMPAEDRPRLKTIRQDVTSLTDYDGQLANKVQFLLDATLGFINIEQNNSIKILTVVSVVGVPPTLVASIYGMNFKMMPELDWAWGYPYGLTMIVLTAVIPLIWFKRKGWI